MLSEAKGAAQSSFIQLIPPTSKLKSHQFPVLECSVKHHTEPEDCILRTKKVWFHDVPDLSKQNKFGVLLGSVHSFLRVESLENEYKNSSNSGC